MDTSFGATLARYWSAPEVAINVLVFLNLLGALMLGFLVGYERSYRGRAAGIRRRPLRGARPRRPARWADPPPPPTPRCATAPGDRR